MYKKENTAYTGLFEDLMGQLLPMKMSRNSYFTCADNGGLRWGDVAVQAD